MARFLVTVWPFPGHYYPNLSVASALRARGHEVAFVTGTRARAAIEREGFSCFTFRHVDERGLDRIFFEPQAPRPWWKHRLLVQRARSYDWLVGLLPGQVADIEDAIETWTPDVIVCDPAFWGGFLVIPERSRVPVAIFAYVPYCLASGRDVPPLGFGLPPASSGVLARLRVAAARPLYRLGTSSFRRAANALRRRYNLAPIDVSVTDFSLRMPLYLVAGTRETDFNRQELPTSVHYVGPCIWDRPRTGPPPEWLQRRPRHQPWVYVSEGTIHTQEPIVSRAAARGLADLPVQVVISASEPGGAASLGLDSVAANIELDHWVNIHFSDVLPLARVVVTTGGAGTVLAALGAGVPVVIIPTEWDKPDIAQRVVAAGAGVQLALSSCTPARLREAVAHVLDTPAFRENAQRLAAAFAGSGGPAGAAQLLEELALRRRGAVPV